MLARINFGNLAEFVGSQFIVFGPVFFVAFLILAIQAIRGKAEPNLRILILLALPVLLLVSGQALISRAYANWAATTYVAGVVAVVPWLLSRKRIWLVIAFAFNGALALALPVASMFVDSLSMNGRLLFDRTVGLDERSQAIIEAAKAAGLSIIVAGDRDILADLNYTGRDAGLAYFAVPTKGRAQNHYVFTYPFRGSETDVMFVTTGGAPEQCNARKIAVIEPYPGIPKRGPIYAYRVSGNCWQAT